MKKVLFTSFLMIYALVIQAQSSDYKPNAGFYTLELALKGGIMNTEVSLPENTLLRGRYFLSDQTALRLGLNMFSTTTRTNFWESSGSKNKGVSVENSRSFNINLGYETHPKGTERLSPYMGVDLLFGLNLNSLKGTNTDGQSYFENYEYSYKETGALSAGIRGVLGADYYFTKHVFLGVEAGLSLLKQFSGKSSASITQNNQTQTYDSKSAGSSLEISPAVITGIRIGYVF
jgi:hypothetical protein